jgi:ribonuclease BN (tRNA processing enzyme)
VRLTVIGCSGSMPGPESPASCYLVEHEGFHFVLDLGSGSLGPLQRHLSLGELDAVVLSHLHGDHCLDVCPLYIARRYAGLRRESRIPIYGPHGAAARIGAAYDAFGDPSHDLSREFAFADISGLVELGPFQVRVARMAHPVPTFAVRLDVAGTSLVYSGDTGPTPDLAELARGADLLLAEASDPEVPDRPTGLHMCGREAAEAALAAGVSALVLTHIPPWNDPEQTRAEAAAAFPGVVTLATPGMVVEVGGASEP